MFQTRRRRKFNLSAHLFDSAGMSDSLRRSLFYVILSVAFGSVNGIVTTGAAWTGFLRKIGADAFALGILTAIPVAANSIQVFISYAIERTGKRRELFLWAGIIGRFLWAPIGLIPFFIPMSPEMLRVAIVMLFVAVCSCSNAVISVGFYSLVTDIVPMRIRGRYFSARSAVSLVVAVVTGVLISLLIDHTSGYVGYTIALVLAGVFGALDIACYLRVDWPKMKRPEGRQPSLPRMIASVWKHRDFRNITLMMLFWGFAVNIAAPFYNVYMIEVVKMSYTQITLINQVLPNVIAVFIIAWWGRQMDDYGNKPVMQTTGLFTMIYPLLWLFTGANVFWMLIALNLLSGLLSNAFDLGAQNLYLNAAPDTNRSMFISVYFACTQLLGNAVSSAVGGWLLQNVTPLMERWNWKLFGLPMTRYHYIFLFSGILRMAMILFMLPVVREDGSQPMRALLADSSRGIYSSFARGARGIWIVAQRRRAHKAIRRSESDDSGNK
ncbi:MAG: MFS transporter [Oscillospiraceae bacterium]|jgi:MFS family permease|nr:MFS transporter [Oscillospiraceae bacterium]